MAEITREQVADTFQPPGHQIAELIKDLEASGW
jgi:hypothetical protein